MADQKLTTGQWVTYPATGERLLVLEDQTASSILLTWDAEGKSLRAVNPKDVRFEGTYQYALQVKGPESDDWHTCENYWQVTDDPAYLIDWSDSEFPESVPDVIEKRVVRRLADWEPTDLEVPK